MIELQNDGSGPSFPDDMPPATMQVRQPRDIYHNLKPKTIKRLASEHEIKMLAEKEGNEAKSKRTAQQKVQHLDHTRLDNLRLQLAELNG